MRVWPDLRNEDPMITCSTAARNIAVTRCISVSPDR